MPLWSHGQPIPSQRTVVPMSQDRPRGGRFEVSSWDFRAGVRGLVLWVQQGERILVREGLSGVLIPVLHYWGGWESSFSCGLVKMAFTGCPCIKMCPTPPWFLLLQVLSLVWPLWGEIKGLFLLPWHNLKFCHHTLHPLSASLPICSCWEVSIHKSLFFSSFCSRFPVGAAGSGGPNSPQVP